MDKRQFSFAAKNLINDETINHAFDHVMGALIKDLLAATTPEDRERKFQEYAALRRVRDFLGKQALEADK